MLLIFLCLLFVTIFAEVETNGNGCTVSRCSHHGPAIRFPFWHKDGQPDHCGYPGFQLSCTEKHQTMIELPNSVKLLVKKINYKAQEIEVHDPDSCLPKQLSTLNLSVSPFQFKVKHDHSLHNITLFNCSLPVNRGFLRRIPCSSAPGYQIYVADSYYTLFHDCDNYDLLSCSKMYSIPSVPNDIFKHFYLKWSKPICGQCEEDGKGCRLKSNGTEPETECVGSGRRAQGTVVRHQILNALTSFA